MTTLFRIGKIAKMLDITPKTVRHYHKLGLLAEPQRADNGYRLYSAADLLAIQRIRRLQETGLSLSQIGRILAAPNADSILRHTLQKLQMETNQQIERLRVRHEHIAAFLETQGQLFDLTRIIGVSPTFVALQEKLPTLSRALPPNAVAFDRAIFTQFDAFEGIDSYAQTFVQLADQIVAQPALQDAMRKMGQRLLDVAVLPVGSPDIQRWAEETAQFVKTNDSAFQPLETVTFNSESNAIFIQILEENAAQLLNHAQMEYIQIIAELLRADKSIASRNQEAPG